MFDLFSFDISVLAKSIRARNIIVTFFKSQINLLYIKNRRHKKFHKLHNKEFMDELCLGKLIRFKIEKYCNIPESNLIQ